MQIVISPKYQVSYDFVLQIPIIFNVEGETVYQGRNTIKRFKTSNGEWIVKRYKKPNIIQRIAYTFFKKSKAERAYLYAQKLQSKNICTPEGIAYIEEKKYGLIRDCYFISTSCDAPTLYPTLGGNDDYDPCLAGSLAAFFMELHQKEFLHGDPNLNNILFRKDKNGDFQFVVIDTNRSVFKPSPSKQECLHNLMRITHNRELLKYITLRYAILRGWNTGKSVNIVMKALHRFEKRNKIKQAIKKKFFLFKH